ncbi:MAG: ATP-dependent 6-phosphofructokinase [Dehalococcoidia bacterium]
MIVKRVAVLTSGGDAPGMNAAIRSAVRTGLDKGWEMCGIRHGYRGLISGDIVHLGARDVGGIIEHGGTFLHSARCPEFETEDGQVKGLNVLQQHNIDALLVIGGDGSQAGAYKLSQMGYPVIGIASTIDNDLYGSDISIGVNTALSIALESIDRLRTTASSLDRAFVVEVMGREHGYLALVSGIAGGAEYIVIPEKPCDPEEVAEEIRALYQKGKANAILIVAEGAKYNAEALAQYFREHHERLGFELRITRLGHVQRGGIPSVFDRLLGTRLAASAIEYLDQGKHGILAGLFGDEVRATPLSEVVASKKELDMSLLKLARILAE